jgi:hypothetical protein
MSEIWKRGFQTTAPDLNSTARSAGRMPLPGQIAPRAPPQIRTRPFRASGSSELLFRCTSGVNDPSRWNVQGSIDHGYKPLPCHWVTAAGTPIQPLKPDVQHLVPDTGDRATVSCDSIISIVTSKLSAESAVLLVEGLMPVFSAPACNRPKRPALPIASGLVHYEPLSFAGSAPVMGKAQKVEGFGFRLSLVSPGPRPCESHYSSLFHVDLEAVLLEAPGQHLIYPLSVVFLLEAHHKIVSKPDKERSTVQSRSDALLEPLV